eukprot:1184511-Prorocentrum_minimum.AAC.4
MVAANANTETACAHLCGQSSQIGHAIVQQEPTLLKALTLANSLALGRHGCEHSESKARTLNPNHQYQDPGICRGNRNSDTRRNAYQLNYRSGKRGRQWLTLTLKTVTTCRPLSPEMRARAHRLDLTRIKTIWRDYTRCAKYTRYGQAQREGPGEWADSMGHHGQTFGQGFAIVHPQLVHKVKSKEAHAFGVSVILDG